MPQQTPTLRIWKTTNAIIADACRETALTRIKQVDAMVNGWSMLDPETRAQVRMDAQPPDNKAGTPIQLLPGSYEEVDRMVAETQITVTRMMHIIVHSWSLLDDEQQREAIRMIARRHDRNEDESAAAPAHRAAAATTRR